MFVIGEIQRIIVFVWEALLHVWPLLFVSIPIAVIIKEMDVSNSVNRLFNRNIWVSIVLATLIGAVSPFCSCGVIPVISSLLIAGVPIAPVMSFWLASPSMDPEIFFLSVGSLGWPLAVARISATFLMSLAGGVVTHMVFGKLAVTDILLMNKKKAVVKPLTNVAQMSAIPVVSSSCGCDDALVEEGCACDVPGSEEACGCNRTTQEESCGCSEDDQASVSRYRHLLGSVISSTWFVVRFLLIAYVLEALIIFYVPTEVVTGLFGTHPFFSVLMASLIGIPLYTTNLSALGLVGGLLSKGLSSGAGLAFLMAGATTTLPAMAAVYKLVERRVFMVYLGVTILFATFSGLVYNVLEGFF